MMKKFILFIVLQMALLISIASSHYAVEWYGEEVYLQTAPVDPRDLFYGDYVILNYAISDIDISKFVGDQKPEEGDTVFVLVKKVGNYHQLVSAHLEKIEPSNSDEQVLKGRVEYITKRWDPVQGESDSVESVHVLYGFERYYVSEGTGKELEQKRGQFDVIVKVAPWGQSLSSLKFIASDVLTQAEIQERIYGYFEKQAIPIEIRSSRLATHYNNKDHPVWIAEVMIYSKGQEKSAKTATIVMDAKTGEILEQKEESVKP